MRDELVFSVEEDNSEGEFLKDRSGWGGRGEDGDRSFDNRGQEVLNRDVREWDMVDNFFKLKVDISVLGFSKGGVLKLRA